MNPILSFLPIVIIVTFAIATLLMEVFIKNKDVIAYTSLTAVILSAISSIALWNLGGSVFHQAFFNNMFVVNSYSLFFYMLFFLCAGISIFTSITYLKREEIEHGEYYSLILFALSGMMLMVSSTDLITLFLGLEVMSMAIYILVGFNRNNEKANEALLKYFFLGAFSAGFILYGISFIYGTSGSTELTQIKAVYSHVDIFELKLALVGIILILIGLFFKIAVIPFHFWSPDVYEGSSSPITGFMITAVKVASFALFIRIFLTSFMDTKIIWSEIITLIAILTMFGGNILALTQTNIKRMLAYSSITHTGYLLIGIIGLTNTYNSTSASSMLYYLVAYSLANLGIFACISYISQKGEEFVNIEDYSGLGFKYPLIGITMTILIFSLIGIPPTAGFFAKYYLFSSAINEGMLGLVIIAIINSALSIYYYLKVIVVMYLKESKFTLENKCAKVPTSLVLVYTSLGTLWLGIGTFTIAFILPSFSSVLEWAKISIQSLF